MKWICTLAAFTLLAFVTACTAQEKAAPKYNVGDQAPKFTLRNSAGEEVSLSDLTKKRDFVALVFIRSADW